MCQKSLKLQDYKNFLRAAKIKNKINYLKKKKINSDNVKEDLKEFVENKLILKTQPRFKCERHNVFTKVINKIALSSNDDKRMPLIDLTVCIWNKQRYNIC